jgi:thymidine phosphorylase
VAAGQPLFTLHTDTPERIDRALAALDGAYDIGGAEDYEPTPLIHARID